jgi:hypothetical protein
LSSKLTDVRLRISIVLFMDKMLLSYAIMDKVNKGLPWKFMGKRLQPVHHLLIENSK